MTNEEIKTECELMHGKIKQAESRLKEVRDICKHENTFEGNWSCRVGVTITAMICSDCGILIKFKDFKP